MSNRPSGIFDPGPTHTEAGLLYREADIALRYGTALRDALRTRGVDVFMTRDDGTDPTPVGQRASMAKNADCDVFVALHLNDVDDDSANGLEVVHRDTQHAPPKRRTARHP